MRNYNWRIVFEKYNIFWKHHYFWNAKWRGKSWTTECHKLSFTIQDRINRIWSVPWGESLAIQTEALTSSVRWISQLPRGFEIYLFMEHNSTPTFPNKLIEFPMCVTLHNMYIQILARHPNCFWWVICINPHAERKGVKWGGRSVSVGSCFFPLGKTSFLPWPSVGENYFFELVFLPGFIQANIHRRWDYIPFLIHKRYPA